MISSSPPPPQITSRPGVPRSTSLPVGADDLRPPPVAARRFFFFGRRGGDEDDRRERRRGERESPAQNPHPTSVSSHSQITATS